LGQHFPTSPNRIELMSKHYVGNLSWDTSEDPLRLAFAQDGRNVKDVAIISDRETGRPRGFGFVEMASKADAEAAISALDGTSLDGRSIRVNEAQERAPRGGGGGDRW
jgi:RNA recognition motif-containing protein